MPWTGVAGLLLLLASGVAWCRPVSVVPAWSMAASEAGGQTEDEFDDMLARLKAKGEAKKPGGVGFSTAKEEQKAAAAKSSATAATAAKASSAAIKKVVAEEPEDFEGEEVFAELKPSAYEMIVPLIGTLFIVGIFPLATGVVRQLWVRYKITSRRLCITSGWGGKEYTDVSFKRIKEMKYVRRHLGVDGDLVMELSGGGAVDMQSVPDFVNVYNYIFDRISPEAQEKSMKLSRTA